MSMDCVHRFSSVYHILVEVNAVFEQNIVEAQLLLSMYYSVENKKNLLYYPDQYKMKNFHRIQMLTIENYR